MCIGVHLLLINAVIMGGLFAARLSPSLKRLIDRLHRPSFGHFFAMLVGAIGSAGIVHLALHGVT
jgi:hypothetical protein